MSKTEKENFIKQIHAALPKLPNADQKDLQKFADEFLLYVTQKDLQFIDPQQFATQIADYWKICCKKNNKQMVIDIKNYPEPRPHGGEKKRYRTSFFFAVPDMQFTVGTVLNNLRHQNLELHVVLHSVMNPESISLSYDKPVSCIYVETNQLSDEIQTELVDATLQDELNNLRLINDDFTKMKDRLRQIEANYRGHNKASSTEVAEFISWLIDGHYVMFGMRDVMYEGAKNKRLYRNDKKSSLGFFKNPDIEISHYRREGEVMSNEFQHFANGKHHVKVSKSTYISTIHRKSGYDIIRFKRYDDANQLIGEHELCGLFTAEYYSTALSQIPLMRQNMATIFDNLNISHSRYSTGLFHFVINNYPRENLWQDDMDILAENVMAVMEAETCVHSKLIVHVDPYGNFISVNFYVPTDVYSASILKKLITELEQTFNASLREHQVFTSDSLLSRVNMIFNTTPNQIPKFSKDELEKKVIALSMPWHEDLHEILVKEYSESQAQNLYMGYMHAFAINYRDTTSIARTLGDIKLVEQAMVDDDELGLEIYANETGKSKIWHLRMVQLGNVTLSEILPKLESTGAKVGEAYHYSISPLGSPDVTLYDFKLDVKNIDVAILHTEFINTFREIWANRFAVDDSNALTLSVGMHYREILLFRAISAYFKQGKLAFSNARIRECLFEYPTITKLLLKYFHSRFNPEKQVKPQDKALKKKILTALNDVKTLEEDRILHTLLDFMQAVVRTNFYQTTRDKADPIISFKIASSDLKFLPEPRPFREIFVYSERFEAVHLRFGYVARGGLRWSDRQDDFRTEILGLVKAQQVKNAVIVPVGSKGGFVLKTQQPDRENFMKEGVSCYKRFIQAMLDITDNLDGNKIIHPDNVVCHDGDDAYLVVAADKGTATFSDIANGIAVNHGFWLGDAFASGGSVGYDHKKMGITARGAWECVKRHFRELSINIQETPFTVIGVGDMSGDVFGNGMLLSKQIKLRGAFNHMHIFIDPNPDPATSWKERKRMFGLPRSAWSDYDAKLLSKGGRIYERSAKTLQLTPEIRKMLNISAQTVTPDELVRALLMSETELLWFGGIGTYIKAKDESHLDVGDKANNEVRVNASEVGAAVIGEGANLGLTHRSRIEYAINGGRCNTDAVDNSAGVDCSDHEVNLKILLTQAIEAGKLKESDRDALLESLTDDIAALVLDNNYKQSQTLSMILAQGVGFIDQQQQLIRDFVAKDQLNRDLEFLPQDDEIDRRRETHIGINRPELCVLLAYAKNIAYQELVQTNIPDDPFYVSFLYHYFPQKMTDMFGKLIEKHRLKREIIATLLTNQVVNCTGPAFINNMKNRTNADISDIINAFTLVYQVFGLQDLRTQIEALDNKVAPDLQIAMLFETYRTADRMIEWFILNEKKPFDLQKLTKKYGTALAQMSDDIESLVPAEIYVSHQNRIARYSNKGVPSDLATKIGSLKLLSNICEVTQLAEKSKHKTREIAHYYFELSERFAIDWLRTEINLLLGSASKWEKKAMLAVADDLWHFQSQLTHFVVTRYGKNDPNKTMQDFLNDHQKSLQSIDNLLLDCKNQTLSLALLTVTTREMKKLLLMHQ